MTIPLVKEQNYSLTRGASFNENKTIRNDDGSAVDITGYSFTARLGKHAGAVDAETSTVASPVGRYSDFSVVLTDAAGGTFSFIMDAASTTSLEEGKHVYSILMEDVSGTKTEVGRGLIFVSSSFA